MGRILGRLIKRLVTILAIGTVGTMLGWCTAVVIEEAPFWVLVVGLMIVEIALFKLGVWWVKEQD